MWKEWTIQEYKEGEQVSYLKERVQRMAQDKMNQPPTDGIEYSVCLVNSYHK
jgi:hypothetical protein